MFFNQFFDRHSGKIIIVVFALLVVTGATLGVSQTLAGMRMVRGLGRNAGFNDMVIATAHRRMYTAVGCVSRNGNSSVILQDQGDTTKFAVFSTEGCGVTTGRSYMIVGHPHVLLLVPSRT